MKFIWCLFSLSQVNYDAAETLDGWWAEKPSPSQLMFAAGDIQDIGLFTAVAGGVEVRIGDYDYSLRMVRESE